MKGIGVHVCEGCGKVYDNIGEYMHCCEPTEAERLAMVQNGEDHKDRD